MSHCLPCFVHLVSARHVPQGLVSVQDPALSPDAWWDIARKAGSDSSMPPLHLHPLIQVGRLIVLDIEPHMPRAGVMLAGPEVTKLTDLPLTSMAPHHSSKEKRCLSHLHSFNVCCRICSCLHPL